MDDSIAPAVAFGTAMGFFLVFVVGSCVGDQHGNNEVCRDLCGPTADYVTWEWQIHSCACQYSSPPRVELISPR